MASEEGLRAGEPTWENRRIQELENAFGHVHESGEIKGWISDKCAKCGLDLRDRIHTRQGGP